VLEWSGSYGQGLSYFDSGLVVHMHMYSFISDVVLLGEKVCVVKWVNDLPLSTLVEFNRVVSGGRSRGLGMAYCCKKTPAENNFLFIKKTPVVSVSVTEAAISLNNLHVK